MGAGEGAVLSPDHKRPLRPRLCVGRHLLTKQGGASRRLVWASHSLFFPFSFSLFISCIEFVRTTSVNKIIQVSCVRFCNTPTVHRVACSPPRQVALVAMRLPPQTSLRLPPPHSPCATTELLLALVRFSSTRLFRLVRCFQFRIPYVSEITWSSAFFPPTYSRLARYSQDPSMSRERAVFYLMAK